MSYDAGVARGLYVIDTSPAIQSLRDMRAEAAKAAAELRALFQGIQPQSGAGVRAPSLTGQTSSIVQLQRAQAGLELQQARLARTQGDGARAAELEAQAQQRLVSTLSQQNTTTTQTIGIQRQLVGSQLQVVRAAQAAAQAQQQEMDALRNSLKPATQEVGGLTGAFGALKSAVGAAGVGLGAGQVIRFGFDAGRTALSLRETQNALRAVSGSSQVYAEALATARREQILFGGSLQENIEGLQGLVITSRDTGASLAGLVDLSQRLAVKSPEQGAGGSRIALAEAFSEGNITSLSRRFEIPKAKIEALRDASIPAAEKIKVLSDYLDSIGISSAAVAGKVDQSALAFRRFGAAIEGFKVRTGSLLADFTAPLASAGATLLGGFEGTREGLGDLAVASNTFGRALVGIAPASAEADASMRAWADTILGFVGVQSRATLATKAHQVAIDEDRVAIGNQQLQTVVAQRAYAESLELTGVRARALQQVTEQKANADKVAAVDAQTHGIAEEHLSQQAQDAARALLQTGPAGARTAALLAGSSGQIDVLTAAYYRLFAAQQSTAKGATQQDAANFRSLELFGQTADQTNAALQKQTAADLARSQGILQNGTQLQKITELQRLYNDAVRQSGANSAQAITAQNALIAAQRAGGAGRVSAAQSTALQLNNVEESSQLQLLKTQREGLERLRDQAEDYAVRRTRSQEDEDRKIRSLLVRGQKAEAAREREDFALQQRRTQEDFDRERRRTLRNNQEGLGDIGARTDLRQGQISERAALRGVGTGGALPAGVAPLPIGAQGTPSVARTTPQTVARLDISGVVNLDSKQVGTAVFPTIEVLMDESLAISLALIGVPNAGQLGVGGAG